MTAAAYYNENDLKTAAWLRELIKGGHIAHGYVDERPIEDVCPRDLDGFAQCHFFAGIGGWSYALRLAGIADDAPIWTGSCPCQPFSAAGKGGGFADERHLWPAWFHLIAQFRPKLIFGEQVASALVWYDLVQDDLENEGYAVGAAIIGAHSVGAPHIRQRLYFVADSDDSRSQRWGKRRGGTDKLAIGALSVVDQLADSDSSRRQEGRRDIPTARHGEALAADSGARELANADGGRDSGTIPSAQREVERQVRSELDGPWTTVDWLPCRDGKSRPTQPGIHPLAHGVSDRVGLLRGYGNAIVPQAAAAFIEAYLTA